MRFSLTHTHTHTGICSRCSSSHHHYHQHSDSHVQVNLTLKTMKIRRLMLIEVQRAIELRWIVFLSYYTQEHIWSQRDTFTCQIISSSVLLHSICFKFAFTVCNTSTWYFLGTSLIASNRSSWSRVRPNACECHMSSLVLVQRLLLLLMVLKFQHLIAQCRVLAWLCVRTNWQ